TAGGVAAVPGGAYIAGTTFGTLPGQISAGSADAFVRKYDNDGNVQWTRQFGGTQVPFVSPYDYANGVAADASGMYAAGDTTAVLPGQTNTGGSDVYVRKYDPDGNLLWTREFGTAADESGNGVAVDS